ncbi:MAG: 3-dehydroquinate synthase [Legionellales bacterium RIFCSPHIGHO2_12_FULL_37_14]|nr:MAG: 3-dehydroquinate synthase [Legionellales bacterium RIFCSPHIGHO2_12_FULL_37_14]
MPSLTVKLQETTPTSYPILIKKGLLQDPKSWLPAEISLWVIITDTNVAEILALNLQKNLLKMGLKTLLLKVNPGERSKSQRNKSLLEQTMLQHDCDRKTGILALGGGVIGDLAGFIAATYMRGIAYIQLPTTLLAMVDSSVGGKTAINTKEGKNLIGAFWQPKAVIVDSSALETLPQKQLINGLFEALKMFLTHDSASFTWFHKNLTNILARNLQDLENLVYRALKIKTRVVAQDEKEQHERAVLNFGHTIGHALEKITNYRLLHGYAVGFGMLVEAKIALTLKLLTEQKFALIENALRPLGITSRKLAKFKAEEVIAATKFDKKKQSGQVFYVLLKDIGSVKEINGKYVHLVDDYTVNQVLLDLTKD